MVQGRADGARILIVSTGGTVSATREVGTSVGPSLSAQDIVGALPLPPGIVLETEDRSRVLSSQLSARDVFELAAHVGRTLRDRPDLRGVVVTHGTGTLEESAFMASLVINDRRPVVFTGAMRPADHSQSDGPSNVAAAIRVAAESRSKGRGVLIVIADRILDPLDACKQHTTDLAAFGSANYGPLGYVYPDRVEYGRRAEIRVRVTSASPNFKVDLVKFVVGMDDRQIRACVDGGAAGLVVEASGLANVNDVMADALVAAVRAGVTVVVASRVPSGRVYPAYATSGGGVRLVQAGCILSSIPGSKARILLMLALGAQLPPSRLRRLFDP